MTITILTNNGYALLCVDRDEHKIVFWYKIKKNKRNVHENLSKNWYLKFWSNAIFFLREVVIMFSKIVNFITKVLTLIIKFTIFKFISIN